MSETAKPSPRPADGSDRFFVQVYDELRAITRARMHGERPGYTLQSTELVHDWAFARAWLYRQLASDPGGEPGPEPAPEL